MNITNFKHWWLVCLKGLIVFLFGILVFLFPIETTESILIAIAMLIGIAGLLILTAAFYSPVSFLRNLFTIEGLIDFGVAALIIWNPLESASFFAFLFGFWLCYNAFSHLMIAKKEYKGQGDWKMSLTNGFLTLILSIMVMLHPIAGIFSFAYLLSSTSIIFGIFLMYTSFRRWRHEAKSQP